MGRLAGKDWERISTNPDFQLVKRAAKKKANQAPTKRSRELSLEDLATIKSRMDMRDYGDLMFYCMTLCGVTGLHRLGELVEPDEERLKAPRKMVKRESVTMDDRTLRYHLPYSKADNMYNGAAVEIEWSALPTKLEFRRLMLRYLLWRDAIVGNGGTLWITQGSITPSRRWFVERIKGILGAEFAGHSMRSGGATILHQQGATAATIKNKGRWSSDAYQSYVRKHGGLPADESTDDRSSIRKVSRPPDPYPSVKVSTEKDTSKYQAGSTTTTKPGRKDRASRGNR
jgi:hypothetical protein